MIWRILLCFVLTLASARSASSDTPSEMRGRDFRARSLCAMSSIDRTTPTTEDCASVSDAPPAISIETLAEALAEGISTGHPSMPEFRLEPDQINDLLSYLKSLE